MNCPCREIQKNNFLCVFIVLYAFIFALGQWAREHMSFPVPSDPGQTPETDPYEKISDIIMSVYWPAIFCGHIIAGESIVTFFIACALLAFFPSVILTFLWYLYRSRKMVKQRL